MQDAVISLSWISISAIVGISGLVGTFLWWILRQVIFTEAAKRHPTRGECQAVHVESKAADDLFRADLTGVKESLAETRAVVESHGVHLQWLRSNGERLADQIQHLINETKK